MVHKPTIDVIAIQNSIPNNQQGQLAPNDLIAWYWKKVGGEDW